MTDEEKKRYRYVPPNVIKKWHFLNLPILRWIEAAIYIFVIKTIIWNTPFVLKIKIICFVVLSAVVLAISLHGIKNRALSEVIVDIIKDNKFMGKYSLASVNDSKKKTSSKITFDNESNFDKIMRIVKRRFKEFDEKYDSDPR